MPVIDERTEVAEKECKEQCTDMSPIDIRIRHDDDTMIAEASIVERLSDRGSERDDEIFDFCISEYAIQSSLFGVQYFSSQWEDRLEFSVTALFRGTTRRVTLDDIELTFCRIFRATVSEFPRESRALEGSFTDDRVSSISCCSSCTGREETLIDDRFCRFRMLSQKVIKPFIEDLIDDSLEFRIDELFLRLRRESQFGNLHRYDRTDPFEDIDGFEIGIFFLQELLFSSVFIDRASEGHTKSDDMSSSFWSDDIVDE